MTKSEKARNVVSLMKDKENNIIPAEHLQQLISDSARLENIERHFRALLENADTLNILFNRVGEEVAND